MTELEKARQVINEVDLKMVELFKMRMSAAKDVANYKKDHNLPIYDSKREEEIIAKNCSLLNDSKLEPYYYEWFQKMLEVSKEYQKKFIK